jgi:putative transposase
MLCTITIQRRERKGACMPGPQPRPITVSPPQRAVLERLLRQHSLPQVLALRVRIILRAADGARVEPLAAELACSALTVQKWRKRWAAAEAPLAAAEGDPAELAATIATTLADAPRSGRPPTFSAEQVVHIVNLACTSPRSIGRPVDAWTPRELADEAQRQGIVTSISPSSVGRFLGRSGGAAPSKPLLAERQDQSD